MIPKNLIWSGQPDSNWSSLAWKAKVQPLYHTRKLFGTQGEIRTLTFGFGIQRATINTKAILFIGQCSRARTYDPMINSHLLCRLSYMPICLVEGVGFEPTMFTFRNRFTVCRNTTVVAVLPCIVLKVRIAYHISLVKIANRLKQYHQHE